MLHAMSGCTDRRALINTQAHIIYSCESKMKMIRRTLEDSEPTEDVENEYKSVIFKTFELNPDTEDKY